MAAASSRRAVARRLQTWQRGAGNWRLKGLLLALADGGPSPATVAQAWPHSPRQSPRDYVHLGKRAADTDEGAVARELYDADAVRANEPVPRDEYISRALASDTTAELDVLWREELVATVIAGAATRKIARDATTVTEVGAKKGDFPAHAQQHFAATGAEGAEGRFNEEDYVQVNYDCEGHESGFAISDELIDQAAVDQIERQIEAAGMAIENAINRQHLINVVDSAGQDHGSVGGDPTVQAVMEAAENVADNDFDPTNTLVMHPEFRTELADTASLSRFNWTGGAGDEGQGRSPFGLRAFVASDATYNGRAREQVSTSNTWGWESGGEIGAAVYGAPFVHTVIYQDISVSELSAPFTAIHDLQGGVANAWTDSVQPSNNAISTITQ